MDEDRLQRRAVGPAVPDLHREEVAAHDEAAVGRVHCAEVVLAARVPRVAHRDVQQPQVERGEVVAARADEQPLARRVERERASGLEDILSKNKLVQEEHARHKAEKEEEIELLRAALEREAAKRAALTSEMCALRDSACNSSDLSLELAAAESAKAQLLDEGVSGEQSI